MWFPPKRDLQKLTSENKGRRPIECPRHGPRYATFVCKHLVRGTGLGFFTPDPDPVITAEDSADQQAWCAACETIRAEQGGWNDVSERAAEITMICDACFKASRLRNQQ